MAGAAVLGRLSWQDGTVRDIRTETAVAVSIAIDLPNWAGHLPGQHVDVRLTAEDGYVAERSYSIASAPGEPVSIAVERLADGEVSPYLTDELQPGDELEIRGPIGGYFVWDPADNRPLLLLAGGSGVVPLRSILRSRAQAASAVPARLLYSARSLPDVIYREELDGYAANPQVAVSYALTRQQPPGWSGYAGRVSDAVLAGVAWPASEEAVAFACGPTAFVEAMATIMVKLGYPAQRIKTERYGGTGT